MPVGINEPRGDQTVCTVNYLGPRRRLDIIVNSRDAVTLNQQIRFLWNDTVMFVMYE